MEKARVEGSSASSYEVEEKKRYEVEDFAKGAEDDEFNLSPPSPWAVGVAATICLVAGIMCVLAVKLQNRENTPVCNGCESKSFEQPFWQTFIMFCGESVCLIVWFIDAKIRDKKGRMLMIIEFPNSAASFNKPRTPIWWWIFPGLLDLIGTALINVAFTISYASTIQMLRNTMLICTSFFSVVMIRRPLRGHEMIGIVIMTAGMVVAGIQAIRNPDASASVDASKAWIGILCTLIGTIFNAFQLILEEWYFKRAYMPPMACMGIQGIFGVGLNIIAIIICHFAKLYNFQEGWYQMNNNRMVLTGNIWYFIVVFLFNGASICVTKLGSGLLRAVLYSLRAPIVWIIELIVKWQDYATEQLLALILAFVGFAFYAYLFKAICYKSRKLHRFLRFQIPCFCTRPEPDSDEEIQATPALNAQPEVNV